MHEIIPQVDFIDHHTGGAGRSNSPQIRIVNKAPKLKKWAKVYGAPFVVYSKKIPKSFRSACDKHNIPIYFLKVENLIILMRKSPIQESMEQSEF